MPLPLIALALKLLPFVGAVPEVLRAFGGAKAAEAADKVVGVAKAITGEASPEAAVAKIMNDPALQLEFQKALRAERVEFARLALEETKAYLADTQDARRAHGEKRGVYWLGIVILLTFAFTMGFAMYGCYTILTGGLKVTDVGLVAAVFGLLGTVIGYIAANAQQVVNYFFGSSKGSSDKTDRMAAAMSAMAPK